MKVSELVEWLVKCSDADAADCENCPYNRDPYEDGCGKLMSDAAALLRVFAPGEANVEDHV